MDPSSLIFVVIVAIWAAYLLGHWVRRRDQVATARSVDRFSEAMRVLERRPAVRSVPLSRPSARSYVVAPARASAPQVSVKRAPAVSRPVHVPVKPAAAVRPPLEAPTAGRARQVREPARPQRPLARARGRRVQVLVLLGLLIATPVSWVLVAATSAVSWWVGLLVTGALVGTVARLRRSARQARELARRRARQDRRTVSHARRQSRRAVVGEVVAAHRERGTATSAEPSTEVAVEEAPTEVDPADGGWQPVPVPPPTYTLKPKAPPRARPALPPATAPAAAEPAVAERAAMAAPSLAEPVAAAAAFDLDEILERRIASGS